MTSGAPPTLVGRTIGGKYSIAKRIAAGSMGEVYEGIGPDGAPVAVKLMSAAASDLMGEEAQVRFSRECSITAGLRHRHVVSVLDGGVDEGLGVGYLAMALMRGEDLEKALARTGALPPAVAARIVADAARGMAAAHALGIVHRDLKPANIFLDGEGDALVAKVCDFGVSKLVDSGVSEVTSTRSALGSPLYMSPEQLLSPKLVDHRADVWGLGMVLYYALNGAPAFPRNITLPALAIALTSNGVPPLRDTAPWVPEALAAVVHRALARDLGARFSGAAELADALEPFAGAATLLSTQVVGLSARARAAISRDEEAPLSEHSPMSMGHTGRAVAGRYHLGAELRALPRGTLYAARRGATPCEVALFDEATGPRAEAILARARALKDAQSSLSLGVLEAGVDAEQVFVATEASHDATLAERLTQGPLELDAACKIFAAVAAALAPLHARGLVHGHVSPEVVYLGAGGAARLGGLFHAEPAVIAGDEAEGVQLADAPPEPAARCMSPEQARRSVDLTPASDVWSFSVSLLAALSGKHPYANAPTLGTLILMLCTQTLPSTAKLKQAPAALREALDRGLARTPAERAPDLRALAQVLERLAADDEDPSDVVRGPSTVQAPRLE
ncbi:MAG TPA: protein kinase, partial [Polyangiaceae bacterium]|nr:protein kinase [Polyangiaceae bacterium]